MAGQTTNISIRMDSEPKAQVETSLNTPNKETISAMLEAEKIANDPSIKGYINTDHLFAALRKNPDK